MPYATLDGKLILIDKNHRIGGGGEGDVYSMDSLRVAKIYKDADVARERESKIKAMIAIAVMPQFASSYLAAGAAWPSGPVIDDGEFCGFVMRKVPQSMALSDLYSYPPRNDISIADKVTCLVHVCGMLSDLHAMGQVFGDFNPNNILVDPDMTVHFIDTDSFHITSSDGTVHPCQVAFPGYVAPELIERMNRLGETDYGNCPLPTFTQETDRFGLAVHIFRMLMNGIHPIAGDKAIVSGGSSAGVTDADQKVAQGMSPFFGADKGKYQVPPYAPDIDSFPPRLTGMFSRAFVDGRSDPSERPTADEWAVTLRILRQDLQECPRDARHAIWPGQTECAYCAADMAYNRCAEKMYGSAAVLIEPASPDAAKPDAGDDGHARNDSAPSRSAKPHSDHASPGGAAPDGSVALTESNFPDEAFRTAVSDAFDIDKDGTLSAAEIAAATMLVVGHIASDGDNGIASAEGLEYLTELTTLFLAGNQLSVIDVSHNTKLTTLLLWNNRLTGIDVSHNTELVVLDVSGNQITGIDVSHNTKLTTLLLWNNRLTGIDVSHNTELVELSAGGNRLTGIDVSHNTELVELYAGGNQLTDIDVSHNTKLTKLRLKGNPLTSVDVTNCVYRVDIRPGSLTVIGNDGEEPPQDSSSPSPDEE